MTPAPLHLKANWRLEQHGPRLHYLVEAMLDGRRAGLAHGWFEPGGPFVLEKIEIDPAQRSKGHGSAVIARLRDKAREQACTEFVIKGVRAANDGAIRLYESLGARALPMSDDLRTFVISPP